MLYASTVWTSSSVENMQKVFKLEKRAASIILGADTKANSVQLFRKLDWVPFFHEAKVNTNDCDIQTTVWGLPILYVSDADKKR